MPTIRIIKRFMVASGIALAVLAAAAPYAWALDVTGTYEGKVACKGFMEGQPFSQTISDLPLQITRTTGGDDLHVAAFGSILGGTIFDDADKPKRAEASLVSCGAEAEPFPVGLIAHLKFTLTDAALKFTAKSVSAGGSVATCTWTFKRIDTADPGVGNCSPPV